MCSVVDFDESEEAIKEIIYRHATWVIELWYIWTCAEANMYQWTIRQWWLHVRFTCIVSIDFLFSMVFRKGPRAVNYKDRSGVTAFSQICCQPIRYLYLFWTALGVRLTDKFEFEALSANFQNCGIKTTANYALTLCTCLKIDNCKSVLSTQCTKSTFLDR